MTRTIICPLDEDDARMLPDLLDQTRLGVEQSLRQFNPPAPLRAATLDYIARLQRMATVVRAVLREADKA